MILVASPSFAQHVTPPGHPERVERARVLEAVANSWALRGGRTISPRLATHDELLRVHTRGHVERMAATSGQSVMLDPDTFTSPDSYDIALLAAGATVQAAEHAVATREPAFALVRPPGHHAEADRAMGFCLFNNVAVAAAAMLAGGLERIADCRYRRAPWQRHASHVLRGSARTLRIDAPVSVLSRYRCRRRDRCRGWPRFYGERADGRRFDGRGLRAGPPRIVVTDTRRSSGRSCFWCRLGSTRTNAIRSRRCG